MCALHAPTTPHPASCFESLQMDPYDDASRHQGHPTFAGITRPRLLFGTRQLLVELPGMLWAAMPAQLLARPRPDPAPAKHFGTRAQVMLLVFGRPWHFTESLGRLPGRIVAFLRHFCGSVSACASAFWKSGRLFGKAARQEGRFCCFRHRRAAPDHLVRHVVYRFSANETQENPNMTSLQLT